MWYLKRKDWLLIHIAMLNWRHWLSVAWIEHGNFLLAFGCGHRSSTDLQCEMDVLMPYWLSLGIWDLYQLSEWAGHHINWLSPEGRRLLLSFDMARKIDGLLSDHKTFTGFQSEKLSYRLLTCANQLTDFYHASAAFHWLLLAQSALPTFGIEWEELATFDMSRCRATFET